METRLNLKHPFIASPIMVEAGMGQESTITPKPFN